MCLVAAAQEASILKRVAKVGDTWKYRMQAATIIDGKAATFNSLLTETVKAVDAEKGTITVESVSSQNEVKYNDKTSSPANNTTTTVMSAEGAISAIITGSEDPNLYRLANLNALQFAKTAVKIGDSWTVQVAADERGAVESSATYKIEGTDAVGDVAAWKITGVYKETSGEHPASMEATFWVDPKNGSILKMSGVLTNAPFPDLPLLTVKVTLTREN